MPTTSPPRPFGPPDDGHGIDAPLRAELLRISHAVIDHVSLKQALVELAQLSVAHIDGAEGAGTTLYLDGRVVMTAATDPWVVDVDIVQYSFDQGPCVIAAAERTVICSNALDRDRRWPTFARYTGSQGIHSALSLPLLGADQTVGCLNIYSRQPEAFDPVAVDAGNRLAPYAAVALRNAQLRAVTRSVAAELRHSLTDLAEIQTAVGILMLRHSTDWEDAEERLAELAAAQGVPILQLSRVLISGRPAS